jgi:F420H(2)-dependent quinone reductase
VAQPKLVNLMVSTLLRAPVLHRIGSSYVMLLRVRGRKTGRVYNIPVGYARDGTRVLSTTDDRWGRNLEPAATVELLLGRRWHRGRGHLVTEREKVVAGMADLIKGCPRYGKWLSVDRDATGEPSRADLDREVDNGRMLIEITDLRPS